MDRKVARLGMLNVKVVNQLILYQNARLPSCTYLSFELL